jgi:hypothetical protein
MHSHTLSRFVTHRHVWLRLDILWSYHVGSHTLVMYYLSWSPLGWVGYGAPDNVVLGFVALGYVRLS